MSLVHKAAKAIILFILRLLYKLEVRRDTKVKCGPCIIAANHTSFLDPPIIGASVPKSVHFLAKKDLFRTKFSHALLTFFNTHPLEGSISDLGSIKKTCSLLNERQIVAIFPEGHRSEDGSLNPLNPGVAVIALRCNTPIVPAYIHGAYDVWPCTRKYPKLSGKIIVTFGKPIQPSNFQHLNKKEAKQALTDALSEALLELSKSVEGQ